MRAIQFLSELFDPKKSAPLEWESNLGVTYARGNVPIGGHDVSIDITFANIDDGLVNIEFMVGGSFGMTGQGGADVVFSTVIEAVKQFAEMHPKIDTLTFTAEEKSRARMYDTITKRVAKQLGWHVVPYEDVATDPKFKTAMSYGAFLFVIERGAAPKHRQAAQKPQHAEFIPIWYVYSVEDKTAPVIKIKAKTSIDAEHYVRKTVPEYKTLDRMGIGTGKAPPGWGDITDLGTVKYPPKPTPRIMNPLEKALHDKLGA